MSITRLIEVIEITVARIAETIEIVQVARIITTETKTTLHKGQEKQFL